jgi:septum formation protein
VLQFIVMKQPTLLLGSNSPRRRQLLDLCGWDFSVWPANINEEPLPDEEPQAYVLRLAAGKARAAALHAETGQIVVAADTIVVDGTGVQGTPARVLGKPASAAEATAMLQDLRGHSHQVMTGLAVISPADGRLLTDLCVTQVPMRDYTDEEIMTYVASGDPMDKAGAYAIQHPGFHPVTESLSGCFASVMGLPLCHLSRTLRQLGILPGLDIPRACQAALAYLCPIFPAVLRGESAG